MQNLIVVLIVTVAVGYIVHRVRKSAKGEGCGCGCSGCATAKNCATGFRVIKDDKGAE